MTVQGRCQCGNFNIRWQTVDLSLVPRACSCDFCRPRDAAYVSKSGTSFRVSVNNRQLHKVTTHGSQQARFHLCGYCDDLVCVTAEFDGVTYGALNARLLNKPEKMNEPAVVDYSDNDASMKRDRWQANWCSPVSIDPPVGDPE